MYWRISGVHGDFEFFYFFFVFTLSFLVYSLGFFFLLVSFLLLTYGEHIMFLAFALLLVFLTRNRGDGDKGNYKKG